MPISFTNPALMRMLGQNLPDITNPQPNMRDLIQPEDQGMDISDIFKQFPIQHTATDRMNQLLNEFPQRNKPGLGRNILAALGGLGADDPRAALQAQDLIRYRPFYDKLQDWQTRMEPLKGLAQTERYENIARHNLLGDITRGRRADVYEKEQISKAGKRTADVEARSQDLDRKEREFHLREWQAKNPNYSVIKADSDGYLYGYDPKNNKSVQISKPDNTPIKVTSEEEKQKLIQQRQIRTIEARGEEARKTKVKGGWQLIYKPDEDSTYRIDPDTGEEEYVGEGNIQRVGTPGKSTTTTPKGMKPGDVAQDQLNRANEWISANPEFANLITIQGKQVNVGAAKSGILSGVFGGASQQQLEQKRKEANEYIFGKRTPNTTQQKTATPDVNVPPVPSIEQREIGKKYKLGNGKIGTWTGRGFTIE